MAHTNTHTHTHTHTHTRHKKEQTPAKYDNMDGRGDIMLSEISQTEKDHMILLMCGM